jgi:hypothetical protein
MVKLTGCVESLKSTPTVPGSVAFTGRAEIIAKSCIDIPDGRFCNKKSNFVYHLYTSIQCLTTDRMTKVLIPGRGKGFFL